MLPFMNMHMMMAATCCAATLAQACESAAPGAPALARQAVFPPVQLEIRTPVEPTALPSGGRRVLIYELRLQNLGGEPLALRGIEVLGPERRRLALLDAPPVLPPNHAATVFACLGFDDEVPAALSHRALLQDGYADGPAIGTRGSSLPVLAAPLAGGAWTADNDPGYLSHHRTGLLVVGGQALLARRYAIDWKKYRAGASYAGDALDVRSYHAYGADVLAVADGTVAAARDGMPDNIPRTSAGFTQAVASTLDNVSGNFVTLDLGGGRFAQYAHLQPGSVRVKTGQAVRKGQLLGRVGNSGDAREPHLHFQLASGTGFLDSEGLPYVIEGYRLRQADGTWQERQREFPLGRAVVDFR